MNIDTVKYIGTIIEGYNKNKFQSGHVYKFKNNVPGQYEIYDMSGKNLIDTVGLRTFNKCFEGLMLQYKKFPDKYFDSNTDIEFPKSEINKHPKWYKEEYDDNGNEIYYEDSNGYWVKRKFDQYKRKIYWLDRDGNWEKSEYDNNGFKIYWETSDRGVIINYRDRIQEGLMLQYKKFPDRYFDRKTRKEFPKSKIDEHPRWGKREYNNNGNEIYFEDNNGWWVKFEYDNNGNQIYWENVGGNWEESEYDNNGKQIYNEKSNGFWEKWEYDENGNEIYYENAAGVIEDNRNNIQEGLMLPYKTLNKQIFILSFPYEESVYANAIELIKHAQEQILEYMDEEEYVDDAITDIKTLKDAIFNLELFGYTITEVDYNDLPKKVIDNLEADGYSRIDDTENIFEGLMLQYKKFPDRYFDYFSNKEFPREEINKHPRWYKDEYNTNEKVIYREFSDGDWAKYKYDQWGNEIYWLDRDGNWEKREYDIDGNILYAENSTGYIYDMRGHIQEGLMLSYKKHYEPRPDTEMASLFFTLQNLTFAEYVDEIIYTQDDKIQITKNNKMVTISEHQGTFLVIMFLNDEEVKRKTFDSTTDKIYWMDIEDAVDSFMYDPNEPLNEGLMLPYKNQTPEIKVFKYLDKTIKNVKNANKPNIGKNFFKLYDDTTNMYQMEILIYPSGKVSLMAHKIAFIKNILDTFQITKKEFEIILGNWFKSRYSYQIITEGLSIPYKDLSTPEKWFKDLLKQMDIYDKSQQYPDSIFFHINKERYMKYDKNFKILYYHHDKIYSVLESKFGLKYDQINKLVKDMMEEHYKLEVDTTDLDNVLYLYRMEEHYKLEVDTTGVFR